MLNKLFSKAHSYKPKDFYQIVLHRSALHKLCVSVTQSCLTLCDPTYCGPPGSSAHGILQARILE